MTTQVLNWTLNLERGTVYFGKPLPFAGNTYRIILDGGKVDGLYVIYLMSDDGVECLAKSEYDGVNYHIAFNTAALRDAFVREPHEARPFHCYVRNAEYLGPDDLKEGSTVAEGDLTIVWNPLWTEAATGKSYTMKGEPGMPGSPGGKGDKGDAGASAYELAKKAGFEGSEDEWLASLRGAPGSSRVIPLLDADGNESGVWHKLSVQVGDNGKLRLVVDTTPVDDPRQDSLFVPLEGDISIFGTKTFLSSPVVPTIAGADGEVDVADDSQKAVNTKWIRAWWGSIWNGIKTAAQTFSAECTFLRGIIGNVKGDLEGTANRAIADKNGKKIDETYLPLTGGTMTGGIKSNIGEFSITSVNNANAISISGGAGWGKGASFVARGKDNPSYPGTFACNASNGEKNISLSGWPDGTLTWDNKAVEHVVASSFGTNSFYIKYASGLIIQGGTHTVTDFQKDTITLPVAFSNANYKVTATPRITSDDRIFYDISLIKTRTTTSFKVVCNPSSATSQLIEWIAIGK
jgi:hypothetical protein